MSNATLSDVNLPVFETCCIKGIQPPIVKFQDPGDPEASSQVVQCHLCFRRYSSDEVYARASALAEVENVYGIRYLIHAPEGYATRVELAQLHRLWEMGCTSVAVDMTLYAERMRGPFSDDDTEYLQQIPGILLEAMKSDDPLVRNFAIARNLLPEPPASINEDPEAYAAWMATNFLSGDNFAQNRWLLTTRALDDARFFPSSSNRSAPVTDTPASPYIPRLRAHLDPNCPEHLIYRIRNILYGRYGEARDLQRAEYLLRVHTEMCIRLHDHANIGYLERAVLELMKLADLQFLRRARMMLDAEQKGAALAGASNEGSDAQPTFGDRIHNQWRVPDALYTCSTQGTTAVPNRFRLPDTFPPPIDQNRDDVYAFKMRLFTSLMNEASDHGNEFIMTYMREVIEPCCLSRYDVHWLVSHLSLACMFSMDARRTFLEVLHTGLPSMYIPSAPTAAYLYQQMLGKTVPDASPVDADLVAQTYFDSPNEEKSPGAKEALKELQRYAEMCANNPAPGIVDNPVWAMHHIHSLFKRMLPEYATLPSESKLAKTQIDLATRPDTVTDCHVEPRVPEAPLPGAVTQPVLDHYLRVCFPNGQPVNRGISPTTGSHCYHASVLLERALGDVAKIILELCDQVPVRVSKSTTVNEDEGSIMKPLEMERKRSEVAALPADQIKPEYPIDPDTGAVKVIKLDPVPALTRRLPFCYLPRDLNNLSCLDPRPSATNSKPGNNLLSEGNSYLIGQFLTAPDAQDPPDLLSNPDWSNSKTRLVADALGRPVSGEWRDTHSAVIGRPNPIRDLTPEQKQALLRARKGRRLAANSLWEVVGGAMNGTEAMDILEGKNPAKGPWTAEDQQSFRTVMRMFLRSQEPPWKSTYDHLGFMRLFILDGTPEELAIAISQLRSLVDPSKPEEFRLPGFEGSLATFPSTLVMDMESTAATPIVNTIIHGAVQEITDHAERAGLPLLDLDKLPLSVFYTTRFWKPATSRQEAQGRVNRDITSTDILPTGDDGASLKAAFELMLPRCKDSVLDDLNARWEIAEQEEDQKAERLFHEGNRTAKLRRHYQRLVRATRLLVHHIKTVLWLKHGTVEERYFNVAILSPTVYDLGFLLTTLHMLPNDLQMLVMCELAVFIRDLRRIFPHCNPSPILMGCICVARSWEELVNSRQVHPHFATEEQIAFRQRNDNDKVVDLKHSSLGRIFVASGAARLPLTCVAAELELATLATLGQDLTSLVTPMRRLTLANEAALSNFFSALGAGGGWSVATVERRMMLSTPYMFEVAGAFASANVFVTPEELTQIIAADGVPDTPFLTEETDEVGVIPIIRHYSAPEEIVQGLAPETAFERVSLDYLAQFDKSSERTYLANLASQTTFAECADREEAVDGLRIGPLIACSRWSMTTDEHCRQLLTTRSTIKEVSEAGLSFAPVSRWFPRNSEKLVYSHGTDTNLQWHLRLLALADLAISTRPELIQQTRLARFATCPITDLARLCIMGSQEAALLLEPQHRMQVGRVRPLLSPQHSTDAPELSKEHGFDKICARLSCFARKSIGEGSHSLPQALPDRNDVTLWHLLQVTSTDGPWWNDLKAAGVSIDAKLGSKEDPSDDSHKNVPSRDPKTLFVANIVERCPTWLTPARLSCELAPIGSIGDAVTDRWFWEVHQTDHILVAQAFIRFMYEKRQVEGMDMFAPIFDDNVVPSNVYTDDFSIQLRAMRFRDYDAALPASPFTENDTIYGTPVPINLQAQQIQYSGLLQKFSPNVSEQIDRIQSKLRQGEVSVQDLKEVQRVLLLAYDVHLPTLLRSLCVTSLHTAEESANHLIRYSVEACDAFYDLSEMGAQAELQKLMQSADPHSCVESRYIFECVARRRSGLLDALRHVFVDKVVPTEDKEFCRMAYHTYGGLTDPKRLRLAFAGKQASECRIIMQREGDSFRQRTDHISLNFLSTPALLRLIFTLPTLSPRWSALLQFVSRLNSLVCHLERLGRTSVSLTVLDMLAECYERVKSEQSSQANRVLGYLRRFGQTVWSWIWRPRVLITAGITLGSVLLMHHYASHRSSKHKSSKRSKGPKGIDIKK